jgi:hypothetical protein
MTTEEAIDLAITKSATHKPARHEIPEARLIKQWLKSITAIDKSQAGGFSLVGDFAREKEELTPGLFLLYSAFEYKAIEKEMRPKRSDGRKFATDDTGNIIFEEVHNVIIHHHYRGILFDLDVNSLELVNYTRLPTYQWAKKLWKPVEQWLENQPYLEAKIKYWEAETAIREAALDEAKGRLAALKNQHQGANEELAPEISEWLQTAAVLGGKKKQSESDRFEGV